MKTRSQVPGRDSLVAFVHIPKTAGTTLNAILAHQYSADETYEVMMRGMNWIVPRPAIFPRPLISFSKIRRLKLALAEPSSMRLLNGHFDMSLSKWLPADTRFVTLLRDPVERAISHYYHHRRRTIDPIHPLAMKSSLADWVSVCGLVEMDNGQTRRLAGEMNVACGRVTLQMLDRAKSNLAKKFAVVGLTERFDESLILLQRVFNWQLGHFAALNVGENRPSRTQVSEEALKAIEYANRFDLELYQFAADRFEQAMSKIDMAGELANVRSAVACGGASRENVAASSTPARGGCLSAVADMRDRAWSGEEAAHETM